MALVLISALISFITFVLWQRKKLSQFIFSYIMKITTPIYNYYLRKEKTKLLESMGVVLQRIPGPVLEIGIGTGANFEFYPDLIDGIDLYGIEPNQFFEVHARKAACNYPNIRIQKIFDTSAENMRDIENESISCVISTIVLCSVGDQKAVLDEISRVLKPGGHFYFLEHVAADPKSWQLVLQNACNLLWGAAFDGCQLNRETRGVIDQTSFSSVTCRKFHAGLPLAFYLMTPHIVGVAVK